MDLVIEKYGKVDILVNNAGILLSVFQSIYLYLFIDIFFIYDIYSH